MKVVMTLRTRDQVEVVDALVSFHLNAGVDFVIATDHESRDGTAELLEAYEREGCLRLICETGAKVRGAVWRTRMARMAATEYGADWVLNADGDEFWWPRGGALREVLAEIPDRYGLVLAPVRTFVPRPEDGRFFAERMTVRLAPQAPINDPLAIQRRPLRKIVHRADPRVVVDHGAHLLVAPRLEMLPTWHPVEVLHFPVRSVAQLEQRYLAWWAEFERRGRRGDVQTHAAYQRGEMDEHYASLAVDEQRLERGLRDGSLAVDTRLRSVLRSLARSGGPDGRAFSLPSELAGPPAPFRPDAADTASWAVDAATLAEADAVRLVRRIDDVERRLALRGR